MCCAAAPLRFGAGCVIESVVLALFRLHLVPGTSSIAFVASSCFKVRHPPSLCLSVAMALSLSEFFLFLCMLWWRTREDQLQCFLLVFWARCWCCDWFRIFIRCIFWWQVDRKFPRTVLFVWVVDIMLEQCKTSLCTGVVVGSWAAMWRFVFLCVRFNRDNFLVLEG